MTTREIFCTGCGSDVNARLTDGAEIYPHRGDLASKILYVCDGCGNYVGTHSGDRNGGDPLGCIPTPELRAARMAVHAVIDPLWRGGTVSRQEAYRRMRERLGYAYHSGETRTVDDCVAALGAAREIATELTQHQ